MVIMKILIKKTFNCIGKIHIIGLLLSILIPTLLFGIGFIYWQNKESKEDLVALKNSVEESNSRFESKFEEVEEILALAEEKNLTLAEALEEANKRAEELEEEFEDVNENVDELTKITTTDKELLQKYSKVYFLNEHYVPSDLDTIDSKYTYDKSKKYEIHEEVWPFLEDLLKDADDDGLNLKIISAFRSYGEQAVLKGNYVVTYGAGTANQFSADQGYSEHQLGTAVDFTNDTVGSTFKNFENTEEFQWLRNNAYKYGFIMSYPENNSYYKYEPWHWRFVGRDLAKYLYRRDKNFYDISQRDIDEYISKIFD